MLLGAHVLLYSQDAEADRAFFRDVLGLEHVDDGGGWLIFRLPSAEAGIHPAGPVPAIEHGGDATPAAVLYLMCRDLDTTMQSLGARGAEFTAVTEESWGRRTGVRLPSGGVLGLYQPTHRLAIDVGGGTPPT